MDNKRNPDRDKMLENILSDYGNENKKNTPSRNSGSRYNSNNTSGRPTPRKTVNPSALNKNEKTTGFAVSKMPDNSYSESEASATAKMEIPEKSDGFKEYTLNMKNTYTDHNPDYSKKEEEFFNRYSENRGRVKNDNYSQNQNNHPQRKKKKKKRSARLPVVILVTTLILTVSILLSVFIISVGRDMLAIGKSKLVKMITIPEGADAKTVASILEDEGIIENPKVFEFFSGLSDSDEMFIPGQYELSPSYAYETIIEKLTTEPSEDNQETVTVTFIEGTSIYDAAQILEENEVCEAERFIYYFNAGGFNFDFEEKLPESTSTKFYRMEGYLFPDTYKFYKNSDPESVCRKIYQNFDNKMTDEYYSQMQKKGMTLDEVITLASIVQAEAPTHDSMKKVSAVFQNRLANEEEFPKLQSDPTTYYVEEIIKPNIPVKSNAIFEAYDTYKGHGLPPGAIGNPGLDAIEAVLYPDDNNYYYFCADIDTGEIFYSETLEEHEEYLAQINGESSDDDNEDDEDDYYE